MESKFFVSMPRDHYIGVWQSVNDIRALIGEKKWEEFKTMFTNFYNDYKEIRQKDALNTLFSLWRNIAKAPKPPAIQAIAFMSNQ